MVRAEVFERFIASCGRSLIFKNSQDQDIEVKAYFNPIRERQDKILPTESGIWNQGKWLLLGPESQKELIKEGSVFLADGEKFLLERAELMYYKERPAYVWGMAQRVQEVRA